MSNNLIVCDPNIRHGKPCIAGTAMTVHRVATWYQLGSSAEEITRQYPHLALDGVYAALAYYHANRSTIDREIDAEETIALQLEARLNNSTSTRAVAS